MQQVEPMSISVGMEWIVRHRGLQKVTGKLAKPGGPAAGQGVWPGLQQAAQVTKLIAASAGCTRAGALFGSIFFADVGPPLFPRKKARVRAFGPVSSLRPC